jgi:hypothetical protein
MYPLRNTLRNAKSRVTAFAIARAGPYANYLGFAFKQSSNGLRAKAPKLHQFLDRIVLFGNQAVRVFDNPRRISWLRRHCAECKQQRELGQIIMYPVLTGMYYCEKILRGRFSDCNNLQQMFTSAFENRLCGCFRCRSGNQLMTLWSTVETIGI